MEQGYTDLQCITRGASGEEFRQALGEADFVFHLAGVNRPHDPAEFATGNTRLTEKLCAALSSRKRPIPVVFASSIQAVLDNPYGRSKRAAEQALQEYSLETGSAVYLFRLPNVFGKWCRPNYNSAIATFCYNIARGLPIRINDPAAPLQLVYIDDVLAAFLGLMANSADKTGYIEVQPVYNTTVGELADTLSGFAESRHTLTIPRVGTGLTRALYSTYISYLPADLFTYQTPCHEDERGVFVEMLKTPDCGQFSYFTAHPGVTRGEHYHHSKTEKFLVIKGTAHFGFRHIATGETHEVVTHGGEARIVETVPGWTHNVTNIGSDELIVMLWANENFDRNKPDTIIMKVKP